MVFLKSKGVFILTAMGHTSLVGLFRCGDKACFTLFYFAFNWDWIGE